MKQFLFTAFLFMISWNTEAQHVKQMENYQKDKAAISQAVEQYYFRGIYEGDVDLLSKVFYSGTLLFGDVKGQPYAKTLEQYLDGVRNRVSPENSGKEFLGEIIRIDVVNSIAIAEVKVKMYEFYYQDFLSFHKLDGRWLIVHKMMTDIAG